MAYTGLYNANGQIITTAVNGSVYTGLYSPDGNWNIVINDGSVLKGLYHPCGAFNAVVTTPPAPGFYAPNGSMYVIASGTGYVAATPVGNGQYTPPPSSSSTYYIYGF